MQIRRLIAADDLYGYTYLSDPQLSPDGSQVAYVATTIDRESDEYRSAVYLVPSEGGAAPRRYTHGPGKDDAPRWSPDGSRLIICSDREGKAQLYALPTDGGEAARITAIPNGVEQPAWSPDGERVAFIALTGVDLQQEPKEVVSNHYTYAHFKDDGQGLKRGRRHLFVQPLDGGEALRLTHGEDDYGEPAWSPDGRLLAVVSAQEEDRAFVPASDVYLVPAAGGEPRRLTPGDGPARSPSFSPDGTTIAYIGHRNPPETGLSTQDGVWTVPIDGGEPTLRTGGWDRPVGNEDVNSDSRWGSNQHRPVWSPDGSRLLFLSTDHGATNVYSVPSRGGAVTPVTSGPRCVDAFSVGGGRLAYLAGDLLNPGDVYVSTTDGSDEQRLTRANEAFLSGFALCQPEEIVFGSTEGTEIQGWVVRPAGFAEGRRYPLVVEVHGGPHTAYGYAHFHEFQVLAARGYGVLFANPRGSVGYGQEFAACIVKRWGERDYADVMAAADWAEAQSWVDPERIGITGGSYGGFMTNWAVGHTARFQAAVTRRCLSSWASFYGTSDIGPRFSEWMVGGTPWDNPEAYARMSPITYVREMRTPLLVIHSEEDHRCPIEQAEQLFVALKRLGREAELVRFPQESHGLTRSGKPKRRVENLERVAAWFERFMPANGPDR